MEIKRKCVFFFNFFFEHSLARLQIVTFRPEHPFWDKNSDLQYARRRPSPTYSHKSLQKKDDRSSSLGVPPPSPGW